jgi:hypothetical protein
MTAREPLPTLKAVDRRLSKPYRVDHKRNLIMFEMTGWEGMMSRLRVQIARLQNHAGNGGAK